MGLDISAHSRILIVDFGWPDDEDERFAHSEYINPDFPHAVPAHWRQHDAVHWAETPFTKDMSFRAGSYSGYGYWRGILSEYSVGKNSYTEPDVFTEIDGGKHDGMPFVEVINFSDAEGCFYGSVCAKLHKDFVDWQSDFEDFLDKGNFREPWNVNYYSGLYANWMRAFEYGAKDGIVSFH